MPTASPSETPAQGGSAPHSILSYKNTHAWHPVTVLNNGTSPSTLPSAFSPTPMRRLLKILLITLGVVAIGALGAFGWVAYKVSAAEKRREELLKDFVRISDDFTNPKVYRHKNFEKRLANLAPPGANLDHTLGSTFWGISATTYGGIKFGDSHGIGGNSRLYLNINGSIFGPYREYEYSFGRIRDYITSIPPGTPLRIRGRITYDHDIFQVHGSHDYDLSEEDIKALISTIELAETFY